MPDFFFLRIILFHSQSFCQKSAGLAQVRLEDVYLSIVTSTLPEGRIDPLCNVLASHTTLDMCNNFIRKWRDLQFNVDSERQIFFRNFFVTNFIYSQGFARKDTNSGCTSNKHNTYQTTATSIWTQCQRTGDSTLSVSHIKKESDYCDTQNHQCSCPVGLLGSVFEQEKFDEGIQTFY